MLPNRSVLALAFCFLTAVAATAQNANEPVPCPMDAKLCPDGSYVGRTGPNCEFAPCPGATPSPSPQPSPPGPSVTPPVPPQPPAAPVAPSAPRAPEPPR